MAVSGPMVKACVQASAVNPDERRRLLRKPLQCCIIYPYFLDGYSGREPSPNDIPCLSVVALTDYLVAMSSASGPDAGSSLGRHVVRRRGPRNPLACNLCRLVKTCSCIGGRLTYT
jgi:hypothetical protein